MVSAQETAEAAERREDRALAPQHEARHARGLVTGGTLFEELGFYYVGPVDGHDVLALVEVLMALGVSRYVLGQRLSARQIIGMVIIVAGVALLLRSQI